MNCAACLVCTNMLPHFLWILHWLPVEHRRLLQSDTVWSHALLLITFLTSLNCTPHQTLSTPVLMINYFIFLTDARNFQGEHTIFPPTGSLPSLLPSVWNNLPFSVSHAQTVFLQVTAQDSPFLCLFLQTLSTVCSLPQVNVCVGACMCLYWEVCVGGWVGGGDRWQICVC